MSIAPPAKATRTVGYWRCEGSEDLPVPESSSCDNSAFVASLQVIEKQLTALQARRPRNWDPLKQGTGIIHYRGYSNCRICGAKNGAREFFAMGYNWPEGLMHYLAEHKIDVAKYPLMTELRDATIAHVDNVEAKRKEKDSAASEQSKAIAGTPPSSPPTCGAPHSQAPSKKPHGAEKLPMVEMVGFWRDPLSGNDYPEPAEGKRDNNALVSYLVSVQKRLTTKYSSKPMERQDALARGEGVIHYLGQAKCRLCRVPVGSKEFYAFGFGWPEGLEHYLDVHKIDVDSIPAMKNFETQVLQRRESGGAKNRDVPK